MGIVELAQERVEQLAGDDGKLAIEMARASVEPVCWITGGDLFPPLRAFGHAEQVWEADGDTPSGLWEAYDRYFRSMLERYNVHLESSDDALGLYVVDLARWEWVERDHMGETEGSLNDDWQRLARPKEGS